MFLVKRRCSWSKIHREDIRKRRRRRRSRRRKRRKRRRKSIRNIKSTEGQMMSWENWRMSWVWMERIEVQTGEMVSRRRMSKKTMI